MTTATARRSGPVLLAVAPVLLACGVLIGTRPALTADTGFRVIAPTDGTRVADTVTLAWTPARGAASYVVVVDAPLPSPGAIVHAGPQAITLTGRSLTLALGPARTGSPSARTFHTLRVVPVGVDGRRTGETVAVVHVHGIR